MPVSDSLSREPSLKLSGSVFCYHFPRSLSHSFLGTIQIHTLGWVCSGAKIGLKVVRQLDGELVNSTEVIVRDTY